MFSVKMKKAESEKKREIKKKNYAQKQKLIKTTKAKILNKKRKSEMELEELDKDHKQKISMNCPVENNEELDKDYKQKVSITCSVENNEEFIDEYRNIVYPNKLVLDFENSGMEADPFADTPDPFADIDADLRAKADPFDAIDADLRAKADHFPAPTLTINVKVLAEKKLQDLINQSKKIKHDMQIMAHKVEGLNKEIHKTQSMLHGLSSSSSSKTSTLSSSLFITPSEPKGIFFMDKEHITKSNATLENLSEWNNWKTWKGKVIGTKEEIESALKTFKKSPASSDELEKVIFAQNGEKLSKTLEESKKSFW